MGPPTTPPPRTRARGAELLTRLPRPKLLGPALRGRALRESHAQDWPFPETYVAGNLTQVYFEGGACFDAMAEAIAAAREYVYLETYILRADTTGWRIADALAERAREGLKVALLYDAFGSLGLDDALLAELRGAGVEVKAYHPLWPWKQRWALNQRDHRKILVCDGSVGFVGGMNLSDAHLSVERGGEGWRDTHVRLEGPVVVQLQRLFVEEWIRQGGEVLPEAPMAAARPAGLHARIVENRQRARRSLVRGSYFDALYHARRRVWITNSYFAPDRRFLRAMLRAASRGVDVRVILAGQSDVPPVTWAGEHLYDRLLRGGVRIFRWTRTVLHAKTALVDERWCTIGTYNLDQRSYRYNLEVNATLLGEEVVGLLARAFRLDTAVCEEVELEHWRKRGLWRRLRAFIAYRLRRWL
ncbi:MAG: phospholipase D-like domain-containing protein [Deltaproteobacteria bacterium]|nr:phospholipase D-like domain-containing protein [Deltaproteobacteria bacterium]